MSFTTNSSQQISLFDATSNLTQREVKMLERSWAKYFAENIFPAIDEEPFKVLYSDRLSRHNTPVNVIIGALIIKEIFHLTDEEIVETLPFDIRYQYALHTTSFEKQPLKDRTLGRFRARCNTYEECTGIDLIHQCIVITASAGCDDHYCILEYLSDLTFRIFTPVMIKNPAMIIILCIMDERFRKCSIF